MQLKDLYEYLRYGELNQLYIAGTDEGSIKTADKPRIISYINLGLIQLSTRFPLLVKEVLLEEQEGIYTYTLDSRHALTTGSNGYTKYIIDSEYSPFINDIIKIEQVYNEVGIELSLNDTSDTDTLYTPSYNQLVLKNPVYNNMLSIIYRAKYPSIALDSSDTVELDIPSYIIDPLIAFVSYKMYSGLGVDKPEVMLYQNKYEELCIKIDSSGVINTDRPTNLKLEISGWL